MVARPISRLSECGVGQWTTIALANDDIDSKKTMREKKKHVNMFFFSFWLCRQTSVAPFKAIENVWRWFFFYVLLCISCFRFSFKSMSKNQQHSLCTARHFQFYLAGLRYFPFRTNLTTFQSHIVQLFHNWTQHTTPFTQSHTGWWHATWKKNHQQPNKLCIRNSL